MFRPSLRSTRWLVALALLGIILFIIAEKSLVNVQSKWYDEKVEASKLMVKCLSHLKKINNDLGYEIDTTNDPNNTGIIGLSVSPITTSTGILTDKLTALNPNTAAIMIDLLRKAGVDKGTKVAVGLTGANPAANIAMYSALKTIGADPIIISSVGASQFGANKPNFTWLDMERYLYEANLISFKSVAASLGGGKDLGRGLSQEGRELILKAIERNNIPIIKENSLTQNIEKRMDIYRNNNDGLYDVFINIGSGLANIGNAVNASLIYNGVNTKLADKNFSVKGTAMKFADKSAKIIHVNRILKLASRYRLPIEPEPLPKPGQGPVFVTHKNNVKIAVLCLLVLLTAIILVVILDRRDRHYSSNIINDMDKGF